MLFRSKPLYQHLNVDKAAFPNGSRGEDTVKAKQKHKVSHFISNFVKKMNLGRIWFIIIHSFKIQSPIGPPVHVGALCLCCCVHPRNKSENWQFLSRTFYHALITCCKVSRAGYNYSNVSRSFSQGHVTKNQPMTVPI